jgi:hypothetical protein
MIVAFGIWVVLMGSLGYAQGRSGLRAALILLTSGVIYSAMMELMGRHQEKKMAPKSDEAQVKAGTTQGSQT